MHHEENEERRREERRDPSEPNRSANMEQAEGSRETAAGSDVPPAAFGEGGGISNRPAGEEQQRQENVPPRGERREERGRGNEDVEP